VRSNISIGGGGRATPLTLYSHATTKSTDLLVLSTYSLTPGGSLQIVQRYSGRVSSFTSCSGDEIPSQLACCQVRQESHWSMNPSSSSLPQTQRITSSLTTDALLGSSTEAEDEALKTTQNYWKKRLLSSIKTNILPKRVQAGGNNRSICYTFIKPTKLKIGYYCKGVAWGEQTGPFTTITLKINS